MATTYKVSATIIEKIGTANYREIKIQCSSTDTIGNLRGKIHEILEKPMSGYRIQMAYKGTHLKDDSITLQSCNMIPAEFRPIPKMFVTIKQLSPMAIKSKTTRQSENAMNATSEDTYSNDPDPTINDRDDSKTQNSTDTIPQPTTPHNQQPTNQLNTNIPNIPGIPDANDIVDLQYQNLTGNEDDHKQCRLCFSSEENNPLLGKLFSPCRCSGTMKWIHVGCLNGWRAVAPNARSYYRCDQCHYEYNLSRAQWASYVEHPNTSKAISFFILCIVVLLMGLITFKLPLAEFVWDNIEWSPIEYFAHKECQSKAPECASKCNSWSPWAECPRQCYPCQYTIDEWHMMYIEIIFSGLLCLSILGLFVQRKLIWRHAWVFLVTLAQSTRVWRLYLLVGIGHSFYSLLAMVRVVVKRFLFRFGERILAVDQGQQQ